MSKLKTFQNLVFEDFQILVTIDDFSNYGKTKEFDFLNILVRNDVFSNFGKMWRFLVDPFLEITLIMHEKNPDNRQMKAKITPKTA